MMGIALIMFIAMFAAGGQLLGWRDPEGHIQFGIFVSFVLGVVCGYRTRG